MDRLNDESDIQVQVPLDPLSPKELTNAETHCIETAQACLYGRLESGQLRQLSPVTDENGIMRVGGRMIKHWSPMTLNIRCCFHLITGYLILSRGIRAKLDTTKSSNIFERHAVRDGANFVLASFILRLGMIMASLARSGP